MVSAVQDLAQKGWQTMFLAILPAIHRFVVFAFRHLAGEEQEEAVQEALANACLAFVRLIVQGRSERAFPCTLARFSAARVRDGRLVGTASNVRDILSPYAQRKKHLIVERLDRLDPYESMAEDHRTPVPDQVWFRIDFPAWLASFSSGRRRIALSLAAGCSTIEVAKKFSVSSARISEMRGEFYNSWQQFHGEVDSPSRSSRQLLDQTTRV